MSQYPRFARLIWLGEQDAPDHPGGVWRLGTEEARAVIESGLTLELRRLRAEGCIVATHASAGPEARALLRRFRALMRSDTPARLAEIAEDLGLDRVAARLRRYQAEHPASAYGPLADEAWLRLLAARDEDESRELGEEALRHMLLASSKL